MADITKAEYQAFDDAFEQWYAKLQQPDDTPIWYYNAIGLGISIPDLSIDGIKAYLLTNFPEVFI